MDWNWIMMISLHSNRYTRTNNFIIVHWYFNEPIKLTDTTVTKLIFSNYASADVRVEFDNQSNPKYFHNWNYSQFNQSLILTNNITLLNFGFFFDTELELPNSLIYLSFGDCFNKPVILPEFVTHLTLN